jgi:hypothetical protein
MGKPSRLDLLQGTLDLLILDPPERADCLPSVGAAARIDGMCARPWCRLSSQQPDQVLFNRAMSAMRHKRLDVARITLQTLPNTYPNSEYASNAERALEDPRLAECNGARDMKFFDGSSLPCEGSGATALP